MLNREENMKNIIIATILSLIALGMAAHPAQANTYMSYQGRGRQLAQTATRKTSYKKTSVTNKKINRGQRVSNANNTNVAWIPQVEDWQVDHNGNRNYLSSTGQVLVNWGVRGGTCNIRYTEAKEGYFKYRTSAGCDEAQHVVGSLQPGEDYRFQIAQDNWTNWSGNGLARAW
jgi:hypothetical protein